MLSLKLHIIDGYLCSSSYPSYPVVAELISDEVTKVSDRISVRELTLTPLDGSEDNFYGVIRTAGIGKSDGEFEIDNRRSKFLCYDVLEFEDEFSPRLKSGKYIMRLKLNLFEKNNGAIARCDVEAEKIVDISLKDI